ncbi:hypothetical protein C463_07047 [Halorubrum californiense DSM 19288]|uniref:Uncharacterized protein n=1 Tax=Halorubrum californiense DSM 19288 TaxID=1227465 RepID=M0EA72_9EURY|nr:MULTISPECIES: hypothetical protein [Halorubrum]ELZ44696.1 hypothetical protein C463_07047 [Halorubrum californiense DSM 19288]TKX71656.1 hypothetical protein EXE40_07570 [Halorubrum sp. GN11GM_10-3_MGM]
MAAEAAAPSGSPRARVVGLVRRTLFAVRASLGRRDGRATAAAVAAGYLVAYHLGLGHLGRRAGASAPRFDLVVADDPVALAARRAAPFQYEPVALLSVGPVEYLFAPVNAALGLALAALVGVTIAVSVVTWRGPSACRIGAGAGAVAGVPGILSGFACCGPTLLAVIGVQASAGLLAAFQWFLPASVAGLLVTLLWVGSRVDPAAVR